MAAHLTVVQIRKKKKLPIIPVTISHHTYILLKPCQVEKNLKEKIVIQ